MEKTHGKTAKRTVDETRS